MVRDESRRIGGSWFHLDGPEMLNARGPNVFVRVAGITRSSRAAERRCRQPALAETDVHDSMR